MGSKDPSRMPEPDYSTQQEISYRVDLGTYFENSVGTTVEKLEAFPKFVPRQRLARFISKYEIFKRVLNVQGSVIECGMYLGAGLMTFAQLSAILEPVNYQRKIVGFDTFSGFVDYSAEDKKSRSVHMKKGGLSVDASVPEDVRKGIELYDSNRFLSHIPKVFLVEGDIVETMPRYLEDNPHTVVSLLYLDVDLFEPTKVALEHLVPRMPKGAVIAFDELNMDLWPGETTAVLKSVGIDKLRIERFSFDSVVSFAVIE